MPYDAHLVERISRILEEKKADFFAKKMMGGMVFMVDNKMLCGTHVDKKFGASLLMARIGPEVYKEEVKKECCLPMDFTGRPMQGYIFVTSDGYDMEVDLEYWIQLCLDFNPLAKSSKKK